MPCIKLLNETELCNHVLETKAKWQHKKHVNNLIASVHTLVNRQLKDYSVGNYKLFAENNQNAL